jgi:MoxR-like ATPase
MKNEPYAQQIIAALTRTPATLPWIRIDESRRNNSGRCMTALACHRLAQSGQTPRHLRHTRFEWNGGVFSLRNSRITDHHWSTALEGVSLELHELAETQPVVWLLTHWAIADRILHLWAVPEDVAFDAFARLPTSSKWNSKTVEVGTDDHQLKNAPGAPSFARYYGQASLTDAEIAKLMEAIKTDDNIKQERLAAGATAVEADGEAAPEDAELADEEEEAEPPTDLTDRTVEFLTELVDHTDDGAWHEQNKRRYELVLRDPCQRIVDQLRTNYIHRLSPAVASGKRHLSILKKNDYGKGGYHDHYWFAFYDPAAGSKTKSVQLFVRFLGSEGVWRYGLSMGNYCGPYMERLLTAFAGNRIAVAEYVRHALPDTVVRLFADGEIRELTPAEFAARVQNGSDDLLLPGGPLTNIIIVREYPLASLPEHADSLVEEIGECFTWAWPLFDAAVTGVWKTRPAPPVVPEVTIEVIGDVDESAPKTIGELAELTALPEPFLAELEGALLAKQQAILAGPPGTSKTYLARQFARYFVRQCPGRPQGSFEVLYMHANWTYEDFFEGLKPTSKDGTLTFEPRLGFFLKWVEGLHDYPVEARHVLVLDEINRCDTAAVLGELLQLLEYRNSTVPLLSGRSFVFPSNLFIVGTMNSADRSIGRMDLALQRRFLWLKLHPQAETLDRWLKRPGNNPLGFEAETLVQCNDLLADRGIPPEQQIGHALFMLQRRAEDDEASPSLDIPLSDKLLRQIVKFSVLPYVHELMTLQFGRADTELEQQIGDLLLKCVDRSAAISPAEAGHAARTA